MNANAEIGEPERFRNARQVGAYAGLTARVRQSGGHDYHGRISKQGSRWLRWSPGATRRLHLIADATSGKISKRWSRRVVSSTCRTDA